MAIVPNLNVLKDRRSRFRFCVKSSISTLSFQGGEEALRGRIVITIPGTAHADLALSRLQQVPITLTGVLAAAIRMVQELSGGMAIDDRHAPACRRVQAQVPHPGRTMRVEG